MSLGLQSFLAVLPILTAAVLLVGLRWPAKRAMPICYIVAVVVAIAWWKVDTVRVVGASAALSGV